MILILTLALLGAMLLAFSWHQFRQPPNLPERLRAAGALVLGCTLIISAAYSAPGARLRDAAVAGQTDQARLNAELVRVRALSEALGGPQGYIEYLKATKGD